MTIEISPAPEWLDELATEHTHLLRQRIVQGVKQYCIRSNKPYRDVWKAVYEHFEKDTGIALGDVKGTKLDFVQANNKLDDLLKAVQMVTSNIG